MAAYLDAVTELAPWEPPLLEELIRRDTVREARRALADLPIESRVAVLMHAMGYTQTEIAEFLAVPESTIRGRLARARGRLRRRLSARLEAAFGAKKGDEDG